MTEFSTLDCAYFPECSGCQKQGDVSVSHAWLGIKDFFHKWAPQVPVSLVAGNMTHWRTRSKLAVRGTHQAPVIGLFKSGSHEAVSIPGCPLHHPSINAVCSRVREVISEYQIAPYEEKSGGGVLRYLQCVVERRNGSVQLVLTVNSRDKNSLPIKAVKQLYTQGKLHSIWLNFQPAQTNRIFGDEWAHCEGEVYLWERLGEVECAFHPAVFGQANPELFEKVLRRILEWTPPGKAVLELYAGIGVIGLNLAAVSKRVVCVEMNPFSSECFHASHQRLPLNVQHKILMQTASAADVASLIAGNEVIVVDPPRKGLDPRVLDALCEASLGSTLVYLSCGPLSFQRDAEKLCAQGWKMEKAEGYLFFPGTDHVEVLCVFEKIYNQERCV